MFPEGYISIKSCWGNVKTQKIKHIGTDQEKLVKIEKNY